MEFKLLENLNNIINEKMEKRTPILKAYYMPSRGKYNTKPLDLQHLPLNNIPLYTNRLVWQILSKYDTLEDIKFITEEDKLLYKLSILFMLDDGSRVSIEINDLTDNDVRDIKKAVYISYMRNHK